MQPTRYPSQGQQNIFSKQLSTSLSSMLSFWEFGACLAQNNMPVVLKMPVRSHLDEISWTE